MEDKRVGRRRHSREFKAEVLQACREPGASVAVIALARGVNANLVHQWLRLAAPASTLASAEHDSTTVGVCVAGATPPVDKSAQALIDPA